MATAPSRFNLSSTRTAPRSTRTAPRDLTNLNKQRQAAARGPWRPDFGRTPNIPVSNQILAQAQAVSNKGYNLGTEQSGGPNPFLTKNPMQKNIQEILRENNLVNSVNCQNDLSNSNVASWPYGPNATLNNAGLNANLKCRTGVSKNRVSPSNKIMIKPKSKRAFAANVYLNNAKTKKMRIFGKKPENIMNRYMFEREKVQRNMQTAKNQQTAFRTQEYTLGQQAEAARRQAANLTRRAAEARRAKRTSGVTPRTWFTSGLSRKSYATPAAPAASAAPATLKPKKWFQFWKKGGRRSRKNSRKN